MPQPIEKEQAIARLEVCRRSYHDILCEIGRLKYRLEEIRRNPPNSICSAIVYGSKVNAVEKEMREWEELAQEEVYEMAQLEYDVQMGLVK